MYITTFRKEPLLTGRQKCMIGSTLVIEFFTQKSSFIVDNHVYHKKMTQSVYDRPTDKT